MANFVCPFSKKVCNPSCKDWVFDKPPKVGFGVIPFNFTLKDILLNGAIMRNIHPLIAMLMREYQKHYDMYHPEKSGLPYGRCKRIESLQENSEKEK